MLEKHAQATARNSPQDSQNSLARVLWERDLGRSQTPREMRSRGRMSRAQRASRFRFSPAHRARNRQDVPHGEFGLHTSIIHRLRVEKWSMLLFRSDTGVPPNPKRESIWN